MRIRAPLAPLGVALALVLAACSSQAAGTTSPSGQGSAPPAGSSASPTPSATATPAPTPKTLADLVAAPVVAVDAAALEQALVAVAPAALLTACEGKSSAVGGNPRVPGSSERVTDCLVFVAVMWDAYRQAIGRSSSLSEAAYARVLAAYDYTVTALGPSVKPSVDRVLATFDAPPAPSPTGLLALSSLSTAALPNVSEAGLHAAWQAAIVDSFAAFTNGPTAATDPTYSCVAAATMMGFAPAGSGLGGLIIAGSPIVLARTTGSVPDECIQAAVRGWAAYLTTGNAAYYTYVVDLMSYSVDETAQFAQRSGMSLTAAQLRDGFLEPLKCMVDLEINRTQTTC